MKSFKFLLCAIAALTAASCSEEDDVSPVVYEKSAPRGTISKTSATQAEKIASVFAPTRGDASTQSTNKSAKSDTPTDASYYVVDGDTLLFAYNFGNDEGFVVIGGRLAGCPVVAHSDSGRVDFSEETDAGSFEFYISQVANVLKDADSSDSAVVGFWKDIEDDDYTYTVECHTDENSSNKSLYTNQKGWEHIFPSTGYQINRRWSQSGDYNYAAKNGACIGCPAVAIGMLLYDVSLRDTGSKLKTWPQFTYNDIRTWKAKEVSQKFRQIADMIPNYQWGSGPGKSSGAQGADIVKGLKALGFTNAVLSKFDLTTAYQQMCYAENGKIKHRGILLCGVSNRRKGHIWFSDGYQEAAYTVTKKKKGKVVSQQTMYESQLFMNWGQGKNNVNGYFAVEGSNGLAPEADYTYNVMMITGLKEYNKINK